MGLSSGLEDEWWAPWDVGRGCVRDESWVATLCTGASTDLLKN